MLLKLGRMFLICCSLLEQDIKNIVDSKFAKGEYVSSILPKYYEMAILVMNDFSIHFYKFKKTKQDQTQRNLHLFHSWGDPLDIDKIHKALMSQLHAKKGYLFNYCYLFIKIEAFRYFRDFTSVTFQEELVNKLRASFAKLKNYKILAYPINESVNTLTYCFPYDLNIEYVHPLLQRAEDRFYLRTTLDKTQYFMGIRSIEISDDIYNEISCNMALFDMFLIYDLATRKFFEEHIILKLLRNFNQANLTFLCKQLSLDISRLSGKFDEKIYSSENATILNLNSQCLDKNLLPNKISYNEVEDCIQSFPFIGPIYRFVVILVLIKTKTLECVYRSLLRCNDSRIVDLFVKLMKDYGVITTGELTFIQARNQIPLADFMFEYFYIEEIIRRIEISDGILMSDNVEDNQKFLIVIYLTYLRTYKTLDMKSIMEYLDLICYKHVGYIYLQKQKIFREITKKTVERFNELLVR